MVTPPLCPRIHPEAARSIFYDADGQLGVASFQIQIRVPLQDRPRESEVEAAIKSHFLAEAADAGRHFASLLLTLLRQRSAQGREAPLRGRLRVQIAPGGGRPLAACVRLPSRTRGGAGNCESGAQPETLASTTLRSSKAPDSS